MTRRAKDCEFCKAEFEANPKLSASQWEKTRTCSRACRDALCSAERCATRPPLEDVFHAGYRIDSSTGCWLWAGVITQYGYGQFRHRGTMYKAHALSLELDGRPVTAGMMACHHCDTPACVNPAHLYVGTPADNARDASERQRLPLGVDHPQAKLDDLSVRFIRTSGWNNARLARWLGVSRATVARARDRRTWRHVS